MYIHLHMFAKGCMTCEIEHTTMYMLTHDTNVRLKKRVVRTRVEEYILSYTDGETSQKENKNHEWQMPCAWNLPQDFVKTSVTIIRTIMQDKQYKSSYNTSIMDFKMQFRTPIFNAHDTGTNMFLHSSIR